MQPLPIDPLIPEILRSLESVPNLVLEAAPGAGKTTRVPPALLSAVPGGVLVLEPRRLAARLAARRVASELGEPVGRTAGYQVRFEDVSGPVTRLRYLTEGILTRRFLSDPELKGVSAVVLDEFHERHLEGDFALALLRRLQQTRRPDLRILVMSATLDTAPIADYLGGAPVLRAEGRLFPLEIRYAPASAAPLEEQVAQAAADLVKEGLTGDVLVFLPGAAEIRRAQRACEALAARHGLLLAPLYGDLSPEEQDRAIAPADRPKLILSTNIAESSVTIEGVTAVLDSGLVRLASQSPWSGLPTVQVRKISQASAIQRAGRAGRTAPGKVVRLYLEADLVRRPKRDTPEIERADLSAVALELRTLGLQDWDALPWIEAPPEPARQAADRLLVRLGALDPEGRLTPEGRAMSAAPLHPRLARLTLEAARRGAAASGAAIAALLSAGDRLAEGRHPAAPSDLLALLDSDWSPQARRIYRQLEKRQPAPRAGQSSEESLLLAVLAAFPDRVARRRAAGQLLLAGGGSAVLAPASVVQAAEFLVAVDMEERREHGLPLVRLASAIEPEWLLDLFPDRIEERAGVEWNKALERVENAGGLFYEGLPLAESRDVPPDPEQAAALLAAKAWEVGIERFCDPQELAQFRARVAFCAGQSGIPPLTEEEGKAALESLCLGLRSFAELRAAAAIGFLPALEQRLSPSARAALAREAPDRLTLPGGRRTRVFYEEGKPPWVASRLQDFFGMRETPRVANGTIPLVVHLLAPNHRPVQMTSDLAGFWTRLYPELRRQLSRRYPKHDWPEDPLTASPPKNRTR